MNNPIETKAQSLADKMNSLTEKFDLSDEMVVTGEELEGYIQEKTKGISIYESNDSIQKIDKPDSNILEYINLELMVQDFKYIRETLKETTDNGRRVLQSLTLDLLEEDEESKANLVVSFASLNKAVGDNMKLYIQSYKDISSVLMNLDKIQANERKTGPVTNNNTLIVSEPRNTADLIKELANLKG